MNDTSFHAPSDLGTHRAEKRNALADVGAALGWFLLGCSPILIVAAFAIWS